MAGYPVRLDRNLTTKRLAEIVPDTSETTVFRLVYWGTEPDTNYKYIEEILEMDGQKALIRWFNATRKRHSLSTIEIRN